MLQNTKIGPEAPSIEGSLLCHSPSSAEYFFYLCRFLPVGIGNYLIGILKHMIPGCIRIFQMVKWRASKALFNGSGMKSMIIHLARKERITLLLSTVICIISFSCNKDNTIGAEGTSGNIENIYIDTCTVNISTVYIDSIPTSTSDRLLVGAYQTPKLGLVESATFFQMSLHGNDINHDGREDIVDLNTIPNPVYDSIVLVLHRIYRYGDTTQMQTINVH